VVPTTVHPTTVQMGEGNSPAPSTHVHLEGADATAWIACYISFGLTNQSDALHRLNCMALLQAE